MTDEVHKLGEVLRTAREAKGLDLVRVERETKIRERYLAALESGDYADLPGSVYTRGFLRNYGAYLGLDPEYLIDLYRLETSAGAAERPTMPAPPRPLATRRSRAFVVTPGAVVAAILTLMVGGFIAWIGFELVNFARTPELRITEPAGNVSGYTDLTMTVRGTTAPNARVTVSNLPENPSVTADADGHFEVTVKLVYGSNVMRLVATDPVTGRDSAVEQRTIVVVTDVASSPPPAVLAVEAPAADARLESGSVEVAGSAAPGTEVEVAATLVEAAAVGFELTTASGAPVDVQLPAPPTPESVRVTADDAGAFSAPLELAAGTWELRVRAGGDELARRVIVAPVEGLEAVLEIVDGESYVVLEEDGTAVEGYAGSIAPDGEVIELSGNEMLRIRVGNAGAVRITINGVDIGLMGEDAQVVEWRVTRAEG